jgi:hypothetical protein
MLSCLVPSLVVSPDSLLSYCIILLWKFKPSQVSVSDGILLVMHFQERPLVHEGFAPSRLPSVTMGCPCVDWLWGQSPRVLRSALWGAWPAALWGLHRYPIPPCVSWREPVIHMGYWGWHVWCYGEGYSHGTHRPVLVELGCYCRHAHLIVPYPGLL